MTSANKREVGKSLNKHCQVQAAVRSHEAFESNNGENRENFV